MPRGLISIALTILLTTIFSSGGIISAQNNAYNINDDCYPLYQRAEALVGSELFHSVKDSLISMAKSRNDLKAETLAYVLELKHSEASDSADEVQSSVKKLQEVALDNGFMQYYYYGYERLSGFFYNHGRLSQGIEIALEMIQDAKKRDDAYGQWSGNKYLAQIYTAQMDYKSAIQYMLEAVDIQKSSDDPTVKRQPMSNLLTSIAELFGFESDKCLEYLEDAGKSCNSTVDSLFYYYGMAKYSAVHKDQAQYTKFRDLCLSHGSDFTRRFAFAENDFTAADNAFQGRWSDNAPLFQNVRVFPQMSYFVSLARAFGHHKEASDIQHKMIEKVIDATALRSSERTDEAAAALGNLALTKKLLSATRHRMYLILTFFVILAITSVVYTSKLNKEKKRAENANMMKTRFVQNMSHEIRTPLNAIVGFSQLLGLPDGMLTEEEKNQYVGYITNNSDMLSMLVSDILDLSDNEHDHYRITEEDFRCNDLCHTSMNTVETRVPAGVELKFETDVPEEMTLHSDPRRIQQVLTNYLTNACKHTETGEIVLGCSITENPGNVTFSVRDTGVGIPPEKAEEIFQRFTKLDNFVQGSGLGLNICSLIAQKLGAKALLDTSYTGGARFLFILPITGQQKEAEA